MANWFCGSVQYTAVTQWAASTAYSVGNIRRQLATPSAGNERCFRCTTAGTSGGSEPSWTLTKAGTTNDGSAVWTEVTGNSAYNTLGGSWDAPHARLRNAAAWMAAGDILYIRNDHAATENTDIVVTFPGTVAAPNHIISVSSGGAFLAGATDSAVTGNNDYTIAGCIDVLGVTIANSGSNDNIRLGNQTVACKQRWVDCRFHVGATGFNGGIFINGIANFTAMNVVEMVRCVFRFGQASQRIKFNGNLTIFGGSIDGSPGAVITGDLFSQNAAGGRPSNLFVDGCDFSLCGSAFNLFLGGSWSDLSARLRNIKMPASWSGGVVSTALTVPGARIEVLNYGSGDTNNLFWIETFAGSIKSELTYVRTGGAGDESASISWKMETNSQAAYPMYGLRAPGIRKRLASVGGSKTATVQCQYSNVSATPLKEEDIHLEVQALTTSGFPLSEILDDGPADIFDTDAFGSAAGDAQASSSETWAGSLANAVKHSLDVTFTPQEVGNVIGTPVLYKPSTVVYVDPKMAIA